MRKLYVSERDLLFALTNQMQEIAHYLDLETGDVIPVFGFNRDEILRQVKDSPKRFIRLVPQTTRQGVEMMQRFIETVSRPEVREKLASAIQEGRVFSRFREVLKEIPDEFRRWQQFRIMVLTEPLKEKLRCQEIELVLVTEPESSV